MIRVCSTCGGRGLARYWLKNAAHWLWSAPYASAFYGHICRTCGGRGVTGLDDVEDCRDRLRAELRDFAEVLTEWRGLVGMQQLHVDMADDRCDRLRAEFCDLADEITQRAKIHRDTTNADGEREALDSLLIGERARASAFKNRLDWAHQELRDLAERAEELEDHAEWYYGIAEEARIEAGGDPCEDDPPWDRPWHDDQG